MAVEAKVYRIHPCENNCTLQLHRRVLNLSGDPRRLSTNEVMGASVMHEGRQYTKWTVGNVLWLSTNEMKGASVLHEGCQPMKWRVGRIRVRMHVLCFSSCIRDVCDFVTFQVVIQRCQPGKPRVPRRRTKAVNPWNEERMSDAQRLSIQKINGALIVHESCQPRNEKCIDDNQGNDGRGGDARRLSIHKMKSASVTQEGCQPMKWRALRWCTKSFNTRNARCPGDVRGLSTHEMKSASMMHEGGQYTKWRARW